MTLKMLFVLVLLIATTPSAVADKTIAPPESATRTIVLVRHGNYLPNPDADKKLGPGLSVLGVAQAQMAGARLVGFPDGFDALYVSPMQRARDTAAAIAQEFPGRSFSIIDGLEECTPPTWRKEVADKEDPASMAACKKQLDGVFDEYFKPAQGKPRTEMMVCHGNVIRYLVTRALGVDTKSWLEMSPSHASITRIRVEADGRFKVLSVGDVGHIPANMRTGSTGDADRDLGAPALPLQSTTPAVPAR
ncbi:MAG: histidine phosphatase family protein [Dokdonella sp.]